MSISNVFSLFAGISLFLFGMGLMGDGLKRVAGSKLETILYKLSSSPIKGILLGTGTTAIIQSSSATSVMVVGFVNSGMMKVKQAIGIIMGAIIGTSVTGWIICLSAVNGSGVFEIISTSTLTALVAVIGIILKMFSKKQKHSYLADILLGFAVLMFGIEMMSGAVEPLRDSEAFIKMLTTFSNPLLGILVGLLFTCVIQSASAAVGILQALAVTGAINFQIALPVIMGIAIGASVPVLLSALGASASGKRTAFIYLLVDTLGVIIFSIIFFSLNAFIHFSFMTATMSMVSIAALNSVFRVIIVLLLTPLIGTMEKMVTKLIPDKEEDKEKNEDFARLDERFLSSPDIAIEQARVTTIKMAELTKKALKKAISLFDNYSQSGFNKVKDLEKTLDAYEDKVGNYASKIMRSRLNGVQSRDVGAYLHSINDFERISDHALNLAEAAQEIYEKKIVFSEEAAKELKTLVAVVTETIETSFRAFTESDTIMASDIEPLEGVIDYICDKYKENHIERIANKKCEYKNGYVFNDMLTDFERIGDHCSNIGMAVRIDHKEINSQHAKSKNDIQRAGWYSDRYQEYMEQFNID